MHHGLIEGPALGDFCPDNIVLGNIRGNVRRKREPFALSFKTLIVAARFIEKGWVSHGPVRQDAKLVDRFYVLLDQKRAISIKDEIGFFLTFLTALRPSLIPAIKPPMIHFDGFQSRSLALGQALDQSGHR